MNYYTFRLLSKQPLKLECCKWEDGSIIPVTSYTIYPDIHSCNCMATKRECKHLVKALEILRTPEFITNMCYWRWDDVHGWVEMHDIPDFSEFEQAISVC